MDNLTKGSDNLKSNNIIGSIYESGKRFITKELIVYGLSGVFTTVVNYITYFICTRVLDIDLLISNIISWIAAVTFAYITNKIWVFKSKSNTIGDEINKIVKFLGARIITLGVEVGGFFVLVELLTMYDLLAKLIISVFVILFNYVLSKLFIFNKK